jgi:hypothetical protein
MESRIKNKNIIGIESLPKDVMLLTIGYVAKAIQMSIRFALTNIHDGKPRIVKVEVPPHIKGRPN